MIIHIQAEIYASISGEQNRNKLLCVICRQELINTDGFLSEEFLEEYIQFCKEHLH